MKKGIVILLVLFLVFDAGFAKDPMKRGKSNFPADKPYPQVDVSGYEELEYNSLDQYGTSSQYQNTTEYKQLPPSVRVYDGLRHRRLIDLEGQINEKLYVRYKIMQDPDLPQETDIYVEYDKFSIYFGKYDAVLTNGELFSLNKNIDGLHADYIDDAHQFEGIYGEERSHERTFSFYGTGRKDYSLGQTNIVEGTLKVRLNGNDLDPEQYQIDYYEGKIIFENILSTLDKIEGSFEYIDPIEDFLPISSKIRLSGLQYKYKSYTPFTPIIATRSVVYTYNFEEQETVQLPWSRIPSAVKFGYKDSNLLMDVQDPELTKVYIYLGEEKIPWRQAGKLNSFEYPTNDNDKVVTCSFETDKYSFDKTFKLSFAEAVSTKSIELSTENVMIVTFNEINVSADISSEYRLIFSEGTVIVPAESFKENDVFKCQFIPKSVTIDSASMQFKNGSAAMQLIQGVYSISYPLSQDFSSGVQFCYLVLISDGQTISRKIPFNIITNPQGGSALKKIILPDRSLVSFTDEVFQGDARLEQNKDYKINYASGEVKLLRELAATPAVVVKYIYQEAISAKDTIAGNDSQGPFKLSNVLIVPGSAQVLVNGLPLVENDDFRIDGKEGKLYFSKKIKSIESAEVSYQYYKVSNRNEGQSKKEQFNMSTFFAQEKAKGAEASADLSQTLTGTDLSVTSDGTITTINIVNKSYLPLIKDSVKIYIDNVVTESRSISIYNGIITVTYNYVANPSAVFKIDFRYGKSATAPKIYFSGNGSTTVIIDQLQSNFPRPIVYDSVILEHKGINDAYFYPLVYKKDYIIGEAIDFDKVVTSDSAIVFDNSEAWERGIITFVTKNATGTWDTVNKFSNSDQFRLTYKIADSDRPDPGDILHQTYGTKINYNPTDFLSLGLEYDESRKQYQRAVERGSYTTSGNGLAGQEIQLPVPSGNTTLEVVEDSEKVYINDKLKTKNDDYWITYKGGTIRFKSGVILNSADRINVEYNYYSTGVGDVEEIDEKAKAVKLDTAIKIDKTDIAMSYVTVDSKYDPVGNAPSLYTAGTEAKKITITSRPTERLEVYSKVESLKVKNGVYQNDQTQDRYRESTVQQYKVNYGFNSNDSISFIANRSDISMLANEVDTSNYEEDKTAYDTQVDSYFGPDIFRTNLYVKNAESFTDVLDRENVTRIYNRNAKLGNIFKPLNELSFNTSLAQNIDDEFREIRKNSISKAYGEVIRYTPWTIDTSVEYSGADYFTEQSKDADYYDFTRAVGKDRRQVFNFSFRKPNEWSHPIYQELYVHFDDTYTNKASDLYNQLPDISRADNLNFLLRPYDMVTVGWDDRYSRSNLENRNRLDLVQEDIYRFSRVYPTKYLQNIPADFLIINKIEIVRKNNETKRNNLSGSTYATSSHDSYREINQNYSINPVDNLALGVEFANKNTERVQDDYTTSGLKETLSTEPSVIYGFDADYSLQEYSFLKAIKYNWSRDVSDTKVHKTINNIGVITKTKDDFLKLNDTIKLNYSYLQAFDNNHGLDRLEEFRQKTDEGTRYSFGQTDLFSVRYATPISGLGMTYGLNKIYNLQYKNITNENAGKSSLINSFYNSKLLRHDDTNRVMADYTPAPEWVLDSSFYDRKISQVVVEGNLTPTMSSFTGLIKEKSYEVGASYKPWEGFSSRYGWRKNVFDLGFGEESKFTIDYKPLKFDLGEITYHFENILTYGKGTNDPQQEFTMNESQGFVQTAVVDRDDIKVINTLIMKINKDISNVIVDNMVVDINLTRLHLWDRMNPEYCYSVNAFYAKGTLNF